jgi:hypothetical protein
MVAPLVVAGIAKGVETAVNTADAVADALERMKDIREQRAFIRRKQGYLQVQREDVLERARLAASQIQKEGAEVTAEQRAEAAVSGVTTAGGAELKSRINIALDVSTLKSNAARQAWGIEQEIAELTALEESVAREAGVVIRKTVLGQVAVGARTTSSIAGGAAGPGGAKPAGGGG